MPTPASTYLVNAHLTSYFGNLPPTQSIPPSSSSSIPLLFLHLQTSSSSFPAQAHPARLLRRNTITKQERALDTLRWLQHLPPTQYPTPLDCRPGPPRTWYQKTDTLCFFFSRRGIASYDRSNIDSSKCLHHSDTLDHPFGADR